MAELTEAIEAAAQALFKLDDIQDPLISTPGWDEVHEETREWYRTKARAAAELIVAATRREIAEELAAKVEALYGPGADDTYFALMDHLKAIARGRGETGGGQR